MKAPPLSPIFPQPGQIWKGYDFDGMTRYEILILSVSDDSVSYAFASSDSNYTTQHSCSLSIFLALYSPRSSPCPLQKPNSSFKTFSLGLRRFFSELGRLWEKARALRRKPF